jgi:hypothetical protein
MGRGWLGCAEMTEDTQVRAESFINDRVKQYQGWYDKKAVVAKRRFLFMRGFSVVAGSVVPVLINVQYDTAIYGIPILKSLVTLISLLVVIAVSLESVLHYREQWKNYRSTEQFLGHETVAFANGVGHYRESRSEAEALKQFVERVEEAIRAENSATLNVMTAHEPTETSPHPPRPRA